MNSIYEIRLDHKIHRLLQNDDLLIRAWIPLYEKAPSDFQLADFRNLFHLVCDNLHQLQLGEMAKRIAISWTELLHQQGETSAKVPTVEVTVEGKSYGVVYYPEWP